MSKRADNAPRSEVKWYPPEEVMIVGIDTDDGPSHDLFDSESNNAPVIEADVLFTMEHGIIQATLAKRDGKRLLQVAGRGRNRQLRAANPRLIAEGKHPKLLPVVIVQGDARKLRALRHGENSHRREINPMARAREASELLQSMPESQAAVTLGLGVQQFRNVLRLLDLSPAAAKAVTAGKLSATAATKIAELSSSDQEARLGELLVNGTKPTVRDVQAKVREVNGKAPIVTPAMRIKKAIAAIDELDDGSTKDDLWSAIRKIRKALER